MGQGLQLLSWTSSCPACLTLQAKHKEEGFQFIKPTGKDLFLLFFSFGIKLTTMDANKAAGEQCEG